MSTYKIAISEMALRDKIPTGDPRWPDFTGSFRNMELLKSDIAAMINDGHAFTTWHDGKVKPPFAEKYPQWRNSENYVLGQHIGLDFDAGTEASSIPKLAGDVFVRQYAALVYSTPSSLPEAPKSRVLFVLDTPIMQAKNYVLATRALLWLFGGADPKCKDPCRFFYGSMGCDAAFLNRVLPLDKVREIIKQYLATGAEAKAKQERPTVQPAEPAEGDNDPNRLIAYWQRRMMNTEIGQRNNTLNKAAWSLAELARDGKIATSDIYSILEFPALRAGLTSSEVSSCIDSVVRSWRI